MKHALAFVKPLAVLSLLCVVSVSLADDEFMALDDKGLNKF